jgi:hypothetical protein
MKGKRIIGVKERKRKMKKMLVLLPLIAVSLALVSTVAAQQPAFEPVDRTFIYDVQGDGSTKCTWSTTILPRESSILYTFSFRGGETRDFVAFDSRGQELDVDVYEEGGQRTVTLFLAGYEVNKPYLFNVSFFWSGLLTRKTDRYSLFTSVDVGDPQSAKIIVIQPKGAKVGVSTISRGNLTEAFEREVISDRTTLTWQTPNTGNKTEIFIRANYRYYNALLSLQDNLTKIVIGAAIVIVAALLLGYRKRLAGVISEIKKRV